MFVLNSFLTEEAHKSVLALKGGGGGGRSTCTHIPAEHLTLMGIIMRLIFMVFT